MKIMLKKLREKIKEVFKKIKGGKKKI